MPRHSPNAVPAPIVQASSFGSIQAALDSLGTSGGSVHVAQGTHQIPAALKLRNGVTIFGDGPGKTVIQVQARLITYPWHLIQHNPQAMREDFALLGEKGLKGRFSPLATVYGPTEDAFVAESAEVQPFVVLDTTHGPVFVDEEAIVFPHTRIEGPAYIGRQTQIVGGKIREGTCIGPRCRVGGEVEESIIHGYSNKYHDGFLGHSYVGEWVNLGALTTNSDLKNDYGPVEVYVNDQLMNSGDNKVGCFMGDHTKTGTGTLINTGTVIGMMSNLLASGEPLPKLIPSFCWYFRGLFSRGMGLKNMIATARAAMGRRQIELLEDRERRAAVGPDVLQLRAGAE